MYSKGTGSPSFSVGIKEWAKYENERKNCHPRGSDTRREERKLTRTRILSLKKMRDYSKSTVFKWKLFPCFIVLSCHVRIQASFIVFALDLIFCCCCCLKSQHKSPSRRKYSFGSTNSQCSDDDNDSDVGSISSERSYGSRGSRTHHKTLEPGNVSLLRYTRNMRHKLRLWQGDYYLYRQAGRKLGRCIRE